MRCLLVTGASGFVGRHLRPALRAAFPEARLVAAQHGAPAEGWDAAIPFPLEDAAALRAALAALRPEAVVHLAARASVGESFADPLPVWEVNLGGTLRLAEAMRAAVPAARLLFVSTAEVYGLSFQSGRALAEDAPLAPANPYAASKAAADLALGEAALRGLRVLRLRPFNHAGAGQSAAFVLPAFARQVARIEAGLQPPEMAVGALDRWREMLDVRDVCAAYVAALARFDAQPAGAVFNIATGAAVRIGDLLEGLRTRARAPFLVRESPALRRPTDVLRTCGEGGRRALRSAGRRGIRWMRRSTPCWRIGVRAWRPLARPRDPRHVPRAMTIDALAPAYLWVKSFHLMAVMAWMAGLFYLPRLYVYHCEIPPGGGAEHARFMKMERLLLKAIMNPAMIAAWLLAVVLLLAPQAAGFWTEGWWHLKLLCVLLMTWFHMYLAKHRKGFARDERPFGQRHWRIMNEVPTLLMIVIVLMVIVKPF
jgi:GDP-4-dehydro-6-deoxy-D-mannose reductase